VVGSSCESEARHLIFKKLYFASICLILLSGAGCQRQYRSRRSANGIPPNLVLKPLPANASLQLKQVLEGAIEQTKVTTGYDPSYVKIDYPGGDVSIDAGVCSGVVVRAFRKAGIDLQKEIHEDLARAWSAYPKKWGPGGPDSNIDHRRVLNLMTYFERQGKALPITSVRNDYLPGDVVAWDLGGGVDHVGIVTNIWSESEKRCLIVHNIAAGARVEDVLFTWQIKGHYRYFQ
jgi:uncharacterized protein